MEGLFGSSNGGEERYLDDHFKTEIQGVHIVQDVTPDTQRIAEIFNREELDIQLQAMLEDPGPEGAIVPLVESGKVWREFLTRYKTGEHMVAAGIGVAVIADIQVSSYESDVSVEVFDESARLHGGLVSITTMEVPIQNDLQHLINDEPCDQCFRGDHEMVQAPVMVLSDAYIERVNHEGGIDVLLLDDDMPESVNDGSMRLVCVPLVYDSTRFGRIIGEYHGKSSLNE